MFFKRPIFYFLLVLLIVIAILNYYAFEYSWYWFIWWFDCLMHFLGGLFIGLSVLWIYEDLIKKDGNLSLKQIIGVAFISTITAGVIWELFELSIDQYWAAHINIKTFATLQAGRIDSLSDLLFDIVGALAAVLLVKSNLILRRDLNIKENEQTK